MSHVFGKDDWPQEVSLVYGNEGIGVREGGQ